MGRRNEANKSLRALSIALTCGAALAADNAAFAAGNTGEALDTYALDEIVVTADRVARHDIDTAATVEVLTHEDLSKTGAENIQQALRYSTGLIAHALGPAGTSEASYNSKIVIRGVEKGTLVLVDGIPINANGKYALDNIPVELVDRVEIVKGGGAVQYGSEATGGVINIITKGKRKNSIRGALGNYGRQNYAVNGQFENLGLSYTYDKTGKENHISAPASTGNYYNMFRVEHSAFNVRYDITDHLYFYDNYSHNTSHWIYRNAPRHDVDYKHALLGYDENIMRLHYDRDGLSATLFYNLFDHKADSYTSRRYNNVFDHTATESYAKALGIDLQKEWRLKHAPDGGQSDPGFAGIYRHQRRPEKDDTRLPPERLLSFRLVERKSQLRLPSDAERPGNLDSRGDGRAQFQPLHAGNSIPV